MCQTKGVGSGSTNIFGAPLKIDLDLCVSCMQSSAASNTHMFLVSVQEEGKVERCW